MESQERFNLFLAYLKAPDSLSLEDRRGIFDRFTEAPQVFPNEPPLWAIRLAVEQEFARGPLRVFHGGEFNPTELDNNRALCIRIMQSGIFRKGGLRASVRAETPKNCPLIHLEGFIRDLAGVLKSARVHHAENLIHYNLEGRQQEAKLHITTLDKALTSLSCVRNTRLAPIQKVDPLIDRIIDLISTIKKNRHVLPKGLSESITQQAKSFKIITALAFIFRHHADLRKDPLAKRISELLTAFNYPTSFDSTKKALQRSIIG